MADNINETLEDLIEALENMVGQSTACCEVGGQQIDDPGDDGVVEVGEGEQFPDLPTYFNAKCNVANGIYDTVVGTVEWLRDNNVDLKAGVLGSITTAIVLALALSGPVGWAIQLSGVAVTVIAGFVIKSVLDFIDLLDGLDDVHEELVQALYTATNAEVAKANFLSVLATATPSPSAPEKMLVGFMLNGTVLNQLFSPRDDVSVYASPDGIDCTGVPIKVWTWPTSVQDWTFADISTGAASAIGSYDALYKALKQRTIIPDGGTPEGAGKHTSPEIAIPVVPGNWAELDYSGPSDGYSQKLMLRVTYTSEAYEEIWDTVTVPGTLVLPITATATIEWVDVIVSRQYNIKPGADDFTSLLTEVRIVQ